MSSSRHTIIDIGLPAILVSWVAVRWHAPHLTAQAGRMTRCIYCWLHFPDFLKGFLTNFVLKMAKGREEIPPLLTRGNYSTALFGNPSQILNSKTNIAHLSLRNQGHPFHILPQISTMFSRCKKDILNPSLCTQRKPKELKCLTQDSRISVQESRNQIPALLSP